MADCLDGGEYSAALPVTNNALRPDNAGPPSHEKRLTHSTVSSAANATNESGSEAEIPCG